MLRTLTAMGCTQADVQLLVWEFPRIFCSNNWRRHIRKFQYLGLYGLPPPGQKSSSRSASSSSNGSTSCGDGEGGDEGDEGGYSSCTDSIDSLEQLLRWL